MSLVSCILLSGGSGSRMGEKIPKQYLKLKNQKIILYSFLTFLEIDGIQEIIIVCEKKYRDIFKNYNTDKKILFALPGNRRQDSVLNGLKKTSGDIIAIHDGARPFVKKEDILNTIKAAKKYGAAVIGSKVTNTIKHNKKSFSSMTYKRDDLFEVYTPQAIKKDLLLKGFKNAEEKKLDVTDDVSLIEFLQKKVKLVEGSKNNIKITTKEDLIVANALLDLNENK